MIKGEKNEMTITEKIKNRILKFLGLEHLSDNPESPRYTFINNDEKIKLNELEENRIWYIGKASELENYYTQRQIHGDMDNPIFERSKQNFFWEIAASEMPIKKVHSGVPHAIVDTLSNVIGMPDISCNGYDEQIKNIIKQNKLTKKLTQRARPLTLVEGWGAWKIVFDKSLTNVPIFQYYEGRDVSFVVKEGIVIGIIYKDYYRVKNKNYILFETRRILNGDSLIEYELYRLGKNDNLAEKVDFSEVEGLQDLPKEGYKISGLNKVLGVPIIYFDDPDNINYGRSIYTGKITLFDDLDQSLSQRSQTCRVSTPVEYYPVDLLERDSMGMPLLPKVYNRQFVKYDSIPNGDGQSNTNNILTTQPNLNFDQYSSEAKAILDMILTGILSPATMGIEVAKKDNADAQREKEKITIMTRDNVMESEIEQLKQLFELGLIICEYLETGEISKTDYDISVKYNEFANPSFESMSQILLPMWNSGAISSRMYVEKLYGSSLSDDEKEREIQELEKQRQRDSVDDLGDLLADDTTRDNIEQETF